MIDISVVIPAYNAQGFLRRAVESVAIQPEPKEIIVIDDGSSDNTLELCHQLAQEYPRIKVLQHEDGLNHGPSATRNRGIRFASSEWISFLDADDYFLPNRFKQAVEIIQNDATVDGVYEAVAPEDESRRWITVLDTADTERLHMELSPIGDKGHFSGDGITIRKQLLLDAGLYSEDMNVGEDVLLWLKCSFLGRLVPGNLVKPVTIFVRHDTNITANVKSYDQQITVLNKFLEWGNDKLARKDKCRILYNQIRIGFEAYIFRSKRSVYHPLSIIAYLTLILKIIVKYPYFITSEYFMISLKDQFNQRIYQ